jgi:hypothetical protein
VTLRGDAIRKGTSIIIEVCITSLNPHFPHQEPQHEMLRSKKVELGTPHFISLNQDIVAGVQKGKCRVCNSHSMWASLNFRSSRSTPGAGIIEVR